MFEYIIIGAGLAGSVIAEQISNVLNKKVMIIENRDHIGGNCYDYPYKNGIIIHKYGPHIFHTESKEVWDYISKFTQWYHYIHYVLGHIDGKNVPIPFNLNTLNELFSKDEAEDLTEKLIQKFGNDVKIPILELRKIDDRNIQALADFIYQKVFLNYTRKQWEMEPEELDHSVMTRVPVYISKDNRYFQDKYQGMPRDGYTKLFKNLLSNENIKILMNTNFKEIIKVNLDKNEIYLGENKFNGKLIYTGKIDEFFDYKFGELPYRSLKFDFKTLNKEYFQEVGTVNYPNDHDFTRITEFKYLTGKKSSKTIILTEYPQKYNKNKNIPYYPIPQKENLKLYQKYKMEAKKFDNVIFLGRLAEYQYYNMDEVIEKALKVFKEKII